MKLICVLTLAIYYCTVYSLGAQSFYSLTAVDIHGKTVKFDEYKGKVVLIANVASECGFTDGHYTALPRLYDLYANTGMFTVLGFPCNQFGAQEPGSNEEILKFVQEKYNVKFPMFSKIDVRGEQQHPLYRFLQDQSGKVPNWNFWKFLVDHKGKVIHSWGHWQDVEETSGQIRFAINDAMKDAALKPPPPVSGKNVKNVHEPQPPECENCADPDKRPKPPAPATPRSAKHAKAPPPADFHAPKTHGHDDL